MYIGTKFVDSSTAVIQILFIKKIAMDTTHFFLRILLIY